MGGNGNLCERCGGWMQPDHSRDGAGPVCVNCGRSARSIPAEVLAALAAERVPNRRVGPVHPSRNSKSKLGG